MAQYLFFYHKYTKRGGRRKIQILLGQFSPLEAKGFVGKLSFKHLG